MVGAYCNGKYCNDYMSHLAAYLYGRRPCSALSVRFISPEDIIYTYTFNNNNIYGIHVGIIITGMRARMWYYVCVRSGRKTSFEHNNRQRATVWELRCIRVAAAGLKEWEDRGKEDRSKWHGTAREAVDIRQQIPVTAGLRLYNISIQANGIPAPLMSGGMPEDGVNFRYYFSTHPITPDPLINCLWFFKFCAICIRRLNVQRSF